jgi:glycosyltransferase involved in cell wall biosynthesis
MHSDALRTGTKAGPFHSYPRHMDWYLAAPFIHSAADQWLGAFVPNEAADLRFHAVPATYHHDRSRKFTGSSAWADYFGHGNAVWRAARASRTPAGILTCFPQLPIPVGLRKRLAFSDLPVVAWTFNLGKLPTGLRRHLAMAAFAAVDRFIVHSRSEIVSCSAWLELPESRFRFVPLQRAARPITVDEDRNEPFVLSMGSAQRDYRLLFGVLAELGYPAVIVAGAHAVAGLTVPANVQVRSGLSTEECHVLAQRARVNVIPVANQDTASGQVTLLDAMMFARAAVITACPASVDYVDHGHDALLVRHGDRDDMKAAIKMLWEDETLRRTIGAAARKTALERFSDEAIGRELGIILREVGAAR